MIILMFLLVMHDPRANWNLVLVLRRLGLLGPTKITKKKQPKNLHFPSWSNVLGRLMICFNFWDFRWWPTKSTWLLVVWKFFQEFTLRVLMQKSLELSSVKMTRLLVDLDRWRYNDITLFVWESMVLLTPSVWYEKVGREGFPKKWQAIISKSGR